MESTYKPHDISGGYGELKVASEIYVVYFDANGFTPAELTRKYVLRRASQLASESEFDCFVILEEKRTLKENFKTTNRLVVKTPFFFSDEKFLPENANLFDENSLIAIFKMFKKSDSAAPVECVNLTSSL